MKRSLLIAVLVLVPFAGLVALGFSFLKDPPPMVLPDPPPVRMPPPTPMVAPVPLGGPVRNALEARPPVRAPELVLLPPPAVAPEPLPLPPAPVDPYVVAVEPLVQQCFKDIAERVKGPIRVTVAFDVLPGGGYAGVEIRKASWPDPHLSACITDAFEDAKFEGTGMAVKRQMRTFTFGSADAGR